MGYILLRCYRGGRTAFLLACSITGSIGPAIRKSIRISKTMKKNEYWDKKQKDRQMRERRPRTRLKP